MPRFNFFPGHLPDLQFELVWFKRALAELVYTSPHTRGQTVYTFAQEIFQKSADSIRATSQFYKRFKDRCVSLKALSGHFLIEEVILSCLDSFLNHASVLRQAAVNRYAQNGFIQGIGQLIRVLLTVRLNTLDRRQKLFDSLLLPLCLYPLHRLLRNICDKLCERYDIRNATFSIRDALCKAIDRIDANLRISLEIDKNFLCLFSALGVLAASEHSQLWVCEVFWTWQSCPDGLSLRWMAPLAHSIIIIDDQDLAEWIMIAKDAFESLILWLLNLQLEVGLKWDAFGWRG